MSVVGSCIIWALRKTFGVDEEKTASSTLCNFLVIVLGTLILLPIHLLRFVLKTIFCPANSIIRLMQCCYHWDNKGVFYGALVTACLTTGAVSGFLLYSPLTAIITPYLPTILLASLMIKLVAIAVVAWFIIPIVLGIDEFITVVCILDISKKGGNLVGGNGLDMMNSLSENEHVCQRFLLPQELLAENSSQSFEYGKDNVLMVYAINFEVSSEVWEASEDYDIDTRKPCDAAREFIGLVPPRLLP